MSVLVIDPPGDEGIVHETVAPSLLVETPKPVGGHGIIASGSGVGVSVGTGVEVGVGVGVGVTVGVGVGIAFTVKLSLHSDQIPGP